DPVVYVAADNPRMKAAVAEARRRWPEFIAAFEGRHRVARGASDGVFSAKAAFRDGEREEFMWVKVTAIENDVVFGTLDNEPGVVKNVRLGQRVKFPLSELNDWIYRQGKDLRGVFTIAAVRAAQQAGRGNAGQY